MIHRERGAAYLAEGKYREAILEYRNAVEIDPDDVEAHFALARAYAQTGHYREAYWEVEETVRLDPTHVEARIKKAQILTVGDAGQKQQSLALARILTEEHPENAQAWLALGQSLNALDLRAEAIPALEKAYTLAPEDTLVIRQLAGIHTSLGNRDAAEPYFQRYCELAPSVISFADYTRFLAQDPSRDEDVFELMTRARQAVPDKQRVGIYALLADFLTKRELYDKAEEILRQGIGAEAGSLHLLFKLARIQAARGDRAAAEATMDEAVETNPYDPQTHIEVALFRREQGDVYGALSAIDRAVALDPTHREARMRRAEYRLEQGHGRGDRSAVLEAAKEAEEVLAENPSDPDARLVMAKVAFAQGDLDKAADFARRALDVRGDWGEVHFLLGSVLFLRNDLVGARAELALALRDAPYLLPARRLAARVHSRLGEDELALGASVLALRRDPEDMEMRVLLAQSFLRLGHREDAVQVLEAVPEGSRSPAVSFALARIALQDRDRDEARRLLISAHRKDDASFPVLAELLELDRQDGRLEDSVGRIRRAMAKRPDDASLVVLRARAALYAGESDEVERLLAKAIALDPDEQSAYRLLASHLAVSGRDEEMLATYEAALAENPDSRVTNMVLGSLYERQGRIQEAIERYERAIATDPGLGVVRNNLAFLLAENGGDLERALALAQKAQELLPENPMVADTLGWVLYRKGVPGAAADYLGQAERGLGDEHPAVGEVRYRLGLALEASGDTAEAMAAYKRALAVAPDGSPKPEWARDSRVRFIRLNGGLLPRRR